MEPAALGRRIWELVGPESAGRHHVSALLDRLDPPGVPESARAGFRAALRRTLAANLAFLEQTRSVLELLERAGVRVLPLKGALFAARHYPHLGARPQSDVDVLVPEEELSRAHEVLVGSGWSEAAPREFYRGHYHWVYENERGALLELHWALKYPGTCAPDLKRVWERAALAEAEGVRFLEMCPEDLLEYMAVNKAMQHFPCLLDFLDLHYVVSASAIDWGRLVEQAETDGTAGPLWFGLWHCRELLGTPVPERALRDLSAQRGARGALRLRRLLARWGGPLGVPVGLLEGPVGRVYEAFFEPRWEGRLRLLRPLLLPSQDRLRALAGGSRLRYLGRNLAWLGRQARAAFQAPGRR